MDDSGESAEAAAAARQAAVIMLGTAIFTLTAIPSPSTSTPWVLVVVLLHLSGAVLAWYGPWAKWGLLNSAGLGLLALVLLSATTWVFDGFASGVGPLFVLVFAWLGLHYPLSVIAFALPFATFGYATALLAADARPRSVASTLVLIPIAATVSVLIRRTVGNLRETRRDLVVKDRWRRALMATLAHDVRSPLSSVMGVLEVLEDDSRTPAAYRRLLESATRQTNRVLRLAIGILEVERIEQGKLHLDLDLVDVAEIASEVAALTQPDLVQVDIPPGFMLLADRERLEQILYNLTNNALRHGMSPVVISSHRDDAHVRITVRDHGLGFPKTMFRRCSTVSARQIAPRIPWGLGSGL